MMNSRRFPTVTAAFWRTAFVAGWVVAWSGSLSSADLEKASGVPVADLAAPSLSPEPEMADSPQATAMATAPVDTADVPTAAEPVKGAVNTDTGSNEPKSIVEAESTDSSQMLPPAISSSQMLPPATSPVQVATADALDMLPGGVKEAVSSTETLDECLAVDVCIDRYLWTLYQRTPKEDTIKVEERRKVSVKKRGKMVTVTKSFTSLLDEDFTWKDPKAAERARMPMMDYVIGGMDRSFKLKLFHTLRAAENAGLSPGITSAFRDDYRQSIASGLKAASNRSYHGGSLRGGYGHGLAADIVSVKGGTRDERWTSSENLWKWIDAHGKEFGIGRPYLDRDPPHVAPTDGKEYAAHHGGTKAEHTASNSKKRNRLADRTEHKRPKTARSSKVRTI
jgi:hypothetical protein